MFCYVRNGSAGVTVHCALLNIKSRIYESTSAKFSLLRARGGKRASRLSSARCGRAHQSDTRSDSSKKRAEDDREKVHKGERYEEKGDEGETKRANEREKEVPERTERDRRLHAST